MLACAATLWSPRLSLSTESLFLHSVVSPCTSSRHGKRGRAGTAQKSSSSWKARDDLFDRRRSSACAVFASHDTLSADMLLTTPMTFCVQSSCAMEPLRDNLSSLSNFAAAYSSKVSLHLQLFVLQPWMTMLCGSPILRQIGWAGSASRNDLRKGIVV